MACIIENITIVNDTSRVIRMVIVSDAPSCGITYDHHSGDSKVSFMLLDNFIGQMSLISKYFYRTGHLGFVPGMPFQPG